MPEQRQPGERRSSGGLRVLAATDLSDPADPALREAAALAPTPADALAVVYVHAGPPYLKRASRHLDERIARMSSRLSETVRDRIRSVSGRQAEVFVEEGVEYAAILRRAESWDADVVVVEVSGRAGLSHTFGGVADRVLHHAHCSVLVARPRTSSGWVLAATDLSDPSLPAIRTAASVARRRGAKLEVVRALGFFEVEARYLLAPSAPFPSQGVYAAAASELSACAARLQIDATSQVLDRPAAAAIVARAESIDAELIVIRARDRTGPGGPSVGSVAAKVARTARCSVLVVREALEPPPA